jgi:hypothetical protein
LLAWPVHDRRSAPSGLTRGRLTTDHPPNKKNGGGADVLPLFCWSMIRKSGHRFSDKIMLKS